ncbi:hypothetical protein [Amycolatopsis sacchari]|uniref:hypothetical protein n=1 Tax=Amycolatopsis sacchari TaxID=115433 RepID=UPI003EBE1233
MTQDQAPGTSEGTPRTFTDKLKWLLSHKLSPDEDPAILLDPEALARRNAQRGKPRQRELTAAIDVTAAYISKIITGKQPYDSVSTGILERLNQHFFGETDINVFSSSHPWQNENILKRMLKHSHGLDDEELANLFSRPQDVLCLRAGRLVNQLDEESLRAVLPELERFAAARGNLDELRDEGYDVEVFDGGEEE